MAHRWTKALKHLLDDPAQTEWAQHAYDDFLNGDQDIAAISRATEGVPRPDGGTGYSEHNWQSQVPLNKREDIESEW